MDQRDCLRCKGTGETFHKGFSYGEKVYPDKTEVCSRCNGAKTYNAPDLNAIVDAVTTGRGMSNGKRKFRVAFPSKLDHYKDRDAARAYFCWRLARFHGGIDMRMPMTAEMVIGGDPYVKELEQLADMLAKAYFGSDMRAAQRWGQAFGII